MVPSFNIVCYSTFRVFTHSTVWWNQLNRLSNTKSVSVSKLKTNEISLLLFWMFFDATFSRSHVVFEISDKGEHGHNAHHVHHHPISERQLALVMRLLLEAIFAKFCEISSILLVLIVLHVMNIRCGHIPHFSVYINSYWIYWFWKLFLIAVVSLWLDHISTLVCKGSKYFFSVHFNKLGKWMFCCLVVLVLLFLRV